MKGAYIPVSHQDDKRIALGYMHQQTIVESNSLMPTNTYVVSLDTSYQTRQGPIGETKPMERSRHPIEDLSDTALCLTKERNSFMKMEQIQNAQTIFSGNSVVELTDTELAKVQGGCSHGYDSQQYCQGDSGNDWGDGNSYTNNSYNNNDNNNNDNNTNLNLLNGLGLL